MNCHGLLAAVALLLLARPCAAQLEPEVLTGARNLHKALSQNSPDPAMAVSVLLAFDQPLHWDVLRSNWRHFLQEEAAGTAREKQEISQAFLEELEQALAVGGGAKQRARNFVATRAEWQRRALTDDEMKESAILFVARLRRLPPAYRRLLQDFTRSTRLLSPRFALPP